MYLLLLAMSARAGFDRVSKSATSVGESASSDTAWRNSIATALQFPASFALASFYFYLSQATLPKNDAHGRRRCALAQSSRRGQHQPRGHHP